MFIIPLVATPLIKVQAASSLFKITIIAPGTANMVRRQWGQIIANSLQELGIEARVVFLGWGAVYDRVLAPTNPAIIGKTYDEGGYDLELVGYTPGLIPNPRPQFLGDSLFYAPTGQNYYLWNNSKSNQLLNAFVAETNETLRAKYMKDWQWLVYNENPVSMLLFEKNVAVVNPSLSGYDWIYFNTGPTPQWLKGKTSVTYAATGEIDSLIPPLSNSWYDTIILACVFNGLIEPNNQKQYVPSLAKSWSVSSDGHTWTLNLRDDALWQDGWRFTADDVLFTWLAMMTPATGSQFVGYNSDIFGSKVKFTWANGTSMYLVNYEGNTWYNSTGPTVTGLREGNVTATNRYQVKVYLPNISGLDKPYGYFYPETLSGNNVIAKHVYEYIPYGDWTAHPSNTGVGTYTVALNGTDTYTAHGPIGTGPYVFTLYDATTQTVTMDKFTSYWNKTALEAISQFGVTKYYVKYIVDKTPALAALKNGEVDILDPNYHMQKDVPTIGSTWGKVIDLPGAGRQELGINMRHPLIGTGVDTPLGKSDPSKAALAAKYVRTAIDYAIPRQLIINNLLDGYGTPGVTAALPTQLYYNTTIPVRPYDLAQARAYLRLAGYTVPEPAAAAPATTVLGSYFPVSGTLYNFTSDYVNTPAAGRRVEVRQTTNNSTYTVAASTTTDSNGRYYLDVPVTVAGKNFFYLYYYPLTNEYLQPVGTPSYLNGTLVKTVTAASLSTTISDATTPLSNQITALQGQLNIALAGLAVAILIGLAGLFMAMRKPSVASKISE